MVNTEVVLWGIRRKNVCFSLLVFFSFLNLSANEILTGAGIDPVSPNSVQPTVTEDPYRKFDHLTKKNGLTSNYVLDILQDKQGFIWIATTEGLNR
ncbi:MAG: hypothetical protein GXO89_12965 [Chlorobi bacterium]|nr:hypothetical protein [Chlorobiota bacterium]